MKTSQEHGDYYEAMRSKFRRWSLVYDLFEFFPKERRAVVGKIKNGERVLELCAGTGTLSVLVAKTYPQCEVYGVDLSPDMLKRARNKSRGSNNIKFFESKAQNVPFADNYFDSVLISFALHEMPEEMRGDVLKEAKRVLAEKGKIIIIDFAKATGLPGMLFRLFLIMFEPATAFKFIEDDLGLVLSKLGFTDIEKEKVSFMSQLITGIKTKN